MRIVFMLCVAFLAAACGKQEPSVIGKWETQAGLAGGTLVLEQGGSGELTTLSDFTFKPVTKLVTWREDGDKILLVTGNQTEIITLSADGQTLTIMGNNNQVEFRRAPPAPVPK